MQLPLPETRDAPILVHRFRLEGELGRGGCGEVHRAWDLLAERPVALKLLRSDIAGPEQEESLRAEFRVLRAIAHPGIVRVFDFGRTDDGAAFYTMQLLEGRDLAASRDGVDPHALLEQAARALDYLHASGLVHSDLKPSNVFHAKGSYTLTDFGLVRRTQGPRRDAPYGTLAYMPPERLRAQDRPPDPREDLYSLGAILYEILTGRPPFAGATPEATLANVMAGNIETELAAVPEPWARLLKRLLAADPAARFASAWDLLAAWSNQFDRPLPVPQVWSPPFVGRRRELGVVRSALTDLARGRGALLSVSGGPGLGKSAFLDAATALASSSGTPAWRIDALAAPRPLALVEELSALYTRWSPALPPAARAAAVSLSGWSRAVQGAADAESVLNVHAHALDAVRLVASAVPHVLLLDDAHRLDHGSRALLRFIAANLRELGILVLVGARAAGTAEEAASLAQDLATVQRNGGAVQMLPLRELGPDDVAALVRRRFEASEELELLAQRISDLTGGHPFFVSEALQHLLLTGQLRRERQGWRLLVSSDRKLLPRMADTILSEHVEAARDEDREIYELLALFPAGADSALLARILERDPGSVAAGLERGVQIGLLSTSAGTATNRFVHELLREACAARCPPATARRLHRRIADALAGTPAEAHHRLAAEEHTEQSLACYRREAENFEKRRAPWEALRYYTAALDTDPRHDDADDLALRVAMLQIEVGKSEAAAALLLQRLVALRRPLLRARYLRSLGEAYRGQGRNEEALFHLQAAAELYRTHAEPDEQRRFAADLARLHLVKGDAPGTIASCQQSLAAIPAGDAPLARAALLLLKAQAERQSGDHLAAEATCRASLDALKPLGRTLELAQTYTQIGHNYLYRRDWEQAERFHRAALKVHTELGDLQGMKGALHNLGSALMRADKLEESIVSYQQSLEIKRRLGDRPGEGSGLNNLGNLWERRGEHRRAFQCYRRGIGIYRRLGRPRELASLFNNMGEVHMRLGSHNKALRLLERARLAAEGLGGAYIAQIIAHNLASTQIAVMDPQAAIRTLTVMAPGVQRSGLHALLAQYEATLALAYASAGDPSRAALHTRQALAATEQGIEVEARLGTLLDLAEAASILGQPEAAEPWAEECEERARRHERPHGLVRALKLLALASRKRGDWDVAESRLEEAAEICRQEGFRYELAQCAKHLALLRWDLGLRARALDDFRRAVSILDALRLRTELGLTYLEFARLQAGGSSGD